MVISQQEREAILISGKLIAITTPSPRSLYLSTKRILIHIQLEKNLVILFPNKKRLSLQCILGLEPAVFR